MFSLVRRALCEVPGRRFATATIEASASTTLLPASDLSLPRYSIDHVTDISEHEATRFPPHMKPIYLPLTSFLDQHDLGQDIHSILAQLDPTVFNHPLRRDILHLCVVQYLDGLRQGTASTKTRAEVRGSGRKLRPQKGSGRARLGDRGSPMLRGGGVAHGPKPRDFSTKLPRKVIELGMRVALSARVHERALSIVPSLEWHDHKTRNLAERLQQLQWQRKTLLVTGKSEVERGLALAARNLQYVEPVTVDQLNVYNVVKWPHVVLDLLAVEHLEKTLSKLPQPVVL